MLAALALLAIAVPQQLATSRLAGMPPITGFYAFAAGTVLFALVGSNSRMSVGADSTIAPLFAVGIAHLAPVGSVHYVALVGILAVMVGLLVALVGLLRLGWIEDYLSTPIITGFLAGVAVIIVMHELPDLFGLPAASGSTVHRMTALASDLGKSNGWSLAIGAAVFLIVIAAERIDPRFPGALLGLITSTVAVAAFGLHAHGVSILGTVAHAAPRLGLTGLSWSALSSTAPLAAVVALVVVTQSAATSRAFAERGGYDVNVGRDFLGVGAGNIAAGLVGSFPVNASPAMTAVVASAGGRTRAAGLGAAAGLAALVPAAGLLKDVPLSTLAAVLIFVATRLFRVRDLIAIARFDVFEFGLAVVTLLAVALIGVEEGIGVAVGLAILDRARRSAHTHLHVLGRISGTTSWVPLSSDPHAVQVNHVLAVLFAAPLWYANANQFRLQCSAALSRAPATPRVVVLDTIGMSDIDYTGSRALRRILDELDEQQIEFAVARAGRRLREGMRRSGVLMRIGEDRFFPSVDAAVAALQSARPSSRC